MIKDLFLSVKDVLIIYQKNIEKTEKGKRARKAYVDSDKYKIRRRKYEQLVRVKEVRKKYRRSNARKVVMQRYSQTEKGKACRVRVDAKRRSIIKSTINNLTLPQWQEILMLQGNSCNICNMSFETTKATRDHIVPVSKGGGLTQNNVQALCQSCNSSKGTKIL